MKNVLRIAVMATSVVAASAQAVWVDLGTMDDSTLVTKIDQDCSQRLVNTDVRSPTKVVMYPTMVYRAAAGTYQLAFPGSITMLEQMLHATLQLSDPLYIGKFTANFFDSFQAIERGNTEIKDMRLFVDIRPADPTLGNRNTMMLTGDAYRYSSTNYSRIYSLNRTLDKTLYPRFKLQQSC